MARARRLRISGRTLTALASLSLGFAVVSALGSQPAGPSGTSMPEAPTVVRGVQMLGARSVDRQFEDSPVALVSVRWGWDGSLAAERWSPVVLRVLGTEPFRGIAEIEYRQDSTQRARIAVPFSVAAGRESEVEMAVNMPAGAGDITVTLTDGRRGTKVEFGDTGRDGTFVKPLIDSYGCRLLVIDEMSAIDAVRRSFPDSPRGTEGGEQAKADAASTGEHTNDTPLAAQESPPVPPEIEVTGEVSSQQSKGTQASDALLSSPPPLPSNPLDPLLAWQQWNGAPIDSRVFGSLAPTNWASYQSVDVVIAKPSDVLALNDRQQLAFRVWLRNGGHLVLMAHEPGNDTERLLSLLGSNDVLTRAEESPLAVLAPAVGDVYARAHGSRPARTVAEYGDGASLSLRRGRAIMLTDRAVREGWWTEFPLVSHGAEGDSASVRAGVVVGPVGLGLVSVCGFTPSKAARTTAETDMLWRAVLDTHRDRTLDATLRDAPSARNGFSDAGNRQWWNQAALGIALDRATVVRPIKPTLFLVLGLCVTVLVVMVSVGDRLILGRYKLLTRSWLSALGWIAAASIVAAAVPAMVRSGRSSIGRIDVIDAIVLSQADDQTTPTSAHAAGYSVVSLFGGKPETLPLPASPKAHARTFELPEHTGEWWRGCATTPAYYQIGSGINRPLTSPLPLRISESATDSLLRGCIPTPGVAVPQWTLRALTCDLPEVAPDQIPTIRVYGTRWKNPDRVSIDEIEIVSVPEGHRVSQVTFETPQSIGTRMLPAGDTLRRFDIALTPKREDARQSPWNLANSGDATSLGFQGGMQSRGMVMRRLLEAAPPDQPRLIVWMTLEDTDKLPSSVQSHDQHRTSVVRVLVPVQVSPATADGQSPLPTNAPSASRAHD